MGNPFLYYMSICGARAKRGEESSSDAPTPRVLAPAKPDARLFFQLIFFKGVLKPDGETKKNTHNAQCSNRHKDCDAKPVWISPYVAHKPSPR
jgi:hypothetical protein